MKRVSGAKPSLAPNRKSSFDGGPGGDKPRIPVLGTISINRGRSSSIERGRSATSTNASQKRSSSSGNIAANQIASTVRAPQQRAPDFRKDKEENIRTVVNFLKEYEYSGACNHKTLQSPSNKDYINIFQFIYAFVDADFVMSSRPEDDIPTLYKALYYPHTIGRTAFLTVAAPHSWPLLLHALCWLIAFVQQMQLTGMEADVMLTAALGGGSDSESRDMAFFAMYCEETYSEFMAGKDTFEVIDEMFLKNFLGSTEELDQARKLNDQLLNELHRLEQTKDYTAELELQIAKLDKSKTELQVFAASLSTHLQQLEAAERQQVEQLKAARQEFQEAEGLREMLQHQFNTQALSIDDVERMREEKNVILRAIDTLKHDISAYNQMQWEKEMAITNHPVAAKCTKFNVALSRFLPEDAISNMSDYELRPVFVQGIEDRNDTVIKPLLHILISQSSSRAATTAQAATTILEELSKAEDALQMKDNELVLQQHAITKLENDCDHEKLKGQALIDSLQHQLGSIQQELVKLNRQKEQDVLTTEQLKRQICESHLSLDAKKKRQSKQEADMSNTLLTAADMVLKFKAEQEVSLGGFVKTCKDTLAALEDDCNKELSLYKAVLTEFADL